VEVVQVLHILMVHMVLVVVHVINSNLVAVVIASAVAIHTMKAILPMNY
jgi:hypothetical protein